MTRRSARRRSPLVARRAMHLRLSVVEQHEAAGALGSLEHRPAAPVSRPPKLVLVSDLHDGVLNADELFGVGVADLQEALHPRGAVGHARAKAQVVTVEHSVATHPRVVQAWCTTSSSSRKLPSRSSSSQRLCVAASLMSVTAS